MNETTTQSNQLEDENEGDINKMALLVNIKDLVNDCIVEVELLEFKKDCSTRASIRNICAFTSVINNWGCSNYVHVTLPAHQAVKEQRSNQAKEIGLNNQTKNREKYIDPLLELMWIEMKYPEKNTNK